MIARPADLRPQNRTSYPADTLKCTVVPLLLKVVNPSIAGPLRFEGRRLTPKLLN